MADKLLIAALLLPEDEEENARKIYSADFSSFYWNDGNPVDDLTVQTIAKMIENPWSNKNVSYEIKYDWNFGQSIL